MNKMFSKKKMLGLLTAGAIVVTTAGSFAVWDQLEATSTGTVTLDKPVTVTAAGGTQYTSTGHTLGVVSNYAATDVTFNIANVTEYKNVELQLTPEVKAGGTDVTEKFNIVVKEDVSGTPTEVKDAKDTTLSSSNAYTITLTPKNGDDTDLIGYANGNTPLDVTVTGTLSEVAPTP